jgi:hypothetical protein
MHEAVFQTRDPFIVDVALVQVLSYIQFFRVYRLLVMGPISISVSESKIYYSTVKAERI